MYTYLYEYTRTVDIPAQPIIIYPYFQLGILEIIRD